MSGMRSPLLARPGAVEAGWPDEGVAAHYGDPMREQRALDGSAGLVDRSNRGVLTISGPDRLSWLHSLTSQHLETLAAGQSTQALILSPTGHVEHHLTLTDDGTSVWVHVEPGAAAALVAFLESMRFMLRVEVADVSGDYAVLTAGGPAAADLAAELGGVRARVNAGPFGAMDLIVARDAAERRSRRAGPARSRPGRDVGVRGPADRRAGAPVRTGHRSPDHPARGRLDRDRSAPEQGLLPRAGDGGPRA